MVISRKRMLVPYNNVFKLTLGVTGLRKFSQNLLNLFVSNLQSKGKLSFIKLFYGIKTTREGSLTPKICEKADMGLRRDAHCTSMIFKWICLSNGHLINMSLMMVLVNKTTIGIIFQTYVTYDTSCTCHEVILDFLFSYPPENLLGNTTKIIINDKNILINIKIN